MYICMLYIYNIEREGKKSCDVSVYVRISYDVI